MIITITTVHNNITIYDVIVDCDCQDEQQCEIDVDMLCASASCDHDNKTCTPNLSQSGSRVPCIVLGITLGLCVVLLSMVTVGWVHTCRVLKTLKLTAVKNSLEEQR